MVIRDGGLGWLIKIRVNRKKKVREQVGKIENVKSFGYRAQKEEIISSKTKVK